MFKVSILRATVAVLLFGGFAAPVHAQLFDNLKAFGNRLEVGDPAVVSTWEGAGDEGPKGIAAGDLNGDGAADLAVSNLDGTVTVFINPGNGKFATPRHLQTGTVTLRDIIIADLTGDGKPDIATASPADSLVFIFPNLGGGSFGPPQTIATWLYARNLAAGDFDGDGALDLAVAGSIVGLRQFKRNPSGEFIAVGDYIDIRTAEESSNPDFVLTVFRRPGMTRDELVATQANLGAYCILSANAGGVLQAVSCTQTLEGVYAAAIGSISGPAAEGRLDLITAHRDQGTLHLHRAAEAPKYFEDGVAQEIPIQGGPRSLVIVDLDGDGWNDVAVVLRNLDLVIALKNNKGKLELSTEMPVGQSPRELATADFNRDGHPDLAVINRRSSDVSILEGYAGQVGFGALDQFYLVDGEVSGLLVVDFNQDGRDDVVQLHRASADISVRLAGPDGSLGAPEHYTIGNMPADMVTKDVNNDGYSDFVAVNLGRPGIEDGSISVRLGGPQGTLGPEARYELPANANASLFAVEVADFDGDGNVDVAAGYMDCRLSFFKGKGDGTFTLPQDLEHPFFYAFGYEVRAMAAGDFDRDGDIDLAGASYSGNIIVAENRGDFFTGTTLTLREYKPIVQTEHTFAAFAMITVDINRDGDLDLVAGNGFGAAVYLGAEGMAFNPSIGALPGTHQLPASSLVAPDFDGDGVPEIAVSCKVLSCIVILKQDGDGEYIPALVVDVPSGKFIASGDLDGDRHADLVGTGEVLWTALSSRRARPTQPPSLSGIREKIHGLVINELLAINNNLPLIQSGRKSDWLELYNGSAGTLQLDGYRLTLSEPDAPGREFVFSGGASIASGAHLMLVAASLPGPLQTGFKLPGTGGTLALFNPEGKEIDRLQYPVQQENVSYGRYEDGLPSFVFNIYPSPGRENIDNGPVPPSASLLAALPLESPSTGPLEAFRPFQPIRFYARGRDDVGIISMSMVYRRLDIPDAEDHRIILFDDGMNEDGGMQDGLFSGVLVTGLPRGGSIQFYLEIIDISEKTIRVPEDAFIATGEGGSVNLGSVYTVAIGQEMPRLQISEFVALNQTGLRDEAGQSSDWVELRNCSDAPVSLDGLYLGDRYPMSEEWYALPAGRVLAPGEHMVIFCDGNPDQGPQHAPFRMNADGGRLVLVSKTPEGGSAILDAVDYASQAADTAMARLDCASEWKIAAQPTPGQPNTLRLVLRGDVDGSNVLDMTDAIAILTHLFLGSPLPCPNAADATGDLQVDITDAIQILKFLYTGEANMPAGVATCE